MPTPFTIERRSFPPRPASLTDLPFVADVKVGPRKTARCFWQVEPAEYGEANLVGMQYAADYVQYLKENPFWVGSGNLGWFISDMAKVGDDSATKGYAVGFWSFVEQLLYHASQKFDHYGMAENKVAQYAAWAAKAGKENDDE